MKKEHEEFLDNLRESGQVNMFGASVYLAREFDLTTKKANSILLEWMNEFKD